MSTVPTPDNTRPPRTRSLRRRALTDAEAEAIFEAGYRAGQAVERRRWSDALTRIADAVEYGTLDQLQGELFAEEVEAWLRRHGEAA